jgi:hypothetical protein
VIGMLHWQTGQVAHLLKGIDEKGGGPVIAVAAKAALHSGPCYQPQSSCA